MSYYLSFFAAFKSFLYSFSLSASDLFDDMNDFSWFMELDYFIYESFYSLVKGYL